MGLLLRDHLVFQGFQPFQYFLQHPRRRGDDVAAVERTFTAVQVFRNRARLPRETTPAAMPQGLRPNSQKPSSPFYGAEPRTAPNAPRI